MFVKNSTRVLRLALLACGLVACAEPTPTENVARVEEAITYGEDALDVVNQRAVVRLVYPGGMCSGTLIAPSVVISAGHCGFPFAGDPFATDPYVWQNLSSSVYVSVGGTDANPAWYGWATKIRWTLDYDVVALQLSYPVPGNIATPWRVITQEPSGGYGTSSTELTGIQNLATSRGFANDLRMIGWGGTNKWDQMRSFAAPNGTAPKHVQCLSLENDSIECMVLSGSTGNELHHYRWQSGVNNNQWSDTLVSSSVNALGGKFSCVGRGEYGINCLWNQYNATLGRGEMLHAYYSEGNGWGTNTWASAPSYNMVGSLSCTSWDNQRIDCFGVANSNRVLVHTWWQPGSYGVELLNDVVDIVGNPSCTSDGTVQLHCAILTGSSGSTRTLRYRGYTVQGGWSLTTLGTGDFASDPTINRYGTDKVLVLVRSASTNALKSRRLSGRGGSWSGWNNVNGMTSVFNPNCTSFNGYGVNCLVSEGADYRSIGFVDSSTSWDTNYYTLIGGNYSGMPVASTWWTWTPSEAPRLDVFTFNNTSTLIKRTFMYNSWQFGPAATRLQTGYAQAQPDTLFDMVTVSGTQLRGSRTGPGDSGGPLALRLSRSGAEEFALVGVLQGSNAWSDANPPTAGTVDRYTPAFLRVVRPGTGTLVLGEWFESFAALGAVTGPLPN